MLSDVLRVRWMATRGVYDAAHPPDKTF
jgi:hypothetical protein